MAENFPKPKKEGIPHIESTENPAAAQWLGLCSFTVKQPGSVPGWGTKIPQAMQHSQNKHTHTHITETFLKIRI